MIEQHSTTYGLRHQDGRFIRISEERDGHYGSEFHLSTDTSDRIYQTHDLHNVLRLMDIEVHEWGTTKDQPSNRAIWKNIDEYCLVSFETKHVYDMEDADPIETQTVVKSPVLRYITGQEPTGLMYDEHLNPPSTRFSATIARYESDTSDTSPILEERTLIVSTQPEPGMFFKTRENNILQVFAVERVPDPFQANAYAILFNHNSAGWIKPETKPLTPKEPSRRISKNGMPY